MIYKRFLISLYIVVINIALVAPNTFAASWTKETVESDLDVGRYPSLALDISGKAHISYYDRTQEDLKYATNASGSWATTTVDRTGNVGKNTSVALDTSGNAYISYYDATNGDLKYATNATGSWVTTTVDDIGDVGYDTSLALDTSGNAHISYYDAANGDLKYAVSSSQSEECAPVSITASPTKLTIKNKESSIITVTVKGKDGCAAEGVIVRAKLDKASKKKISVSPEEETTDADGTAIFTVTGIKKGNAKVPFTASGLTKKINVKVK